MNEVITVNGKKLYLKVSPYNAKKSIPYYRNIIIEAFKKIGIDGQYIDISFGGAGGYRSNSWAKVEWIVNGETFTYKCNTQQRDIDNLAAISQIIETDSKAIRRGLKSFGMVMNQFRLEHNPNVEKIKTPHEILGIAEHITDQEYISFIYKKKAKELHPDTGGDPEKFKELVEAYDKIKEGLL